MYNVQLYMWSMVIVLTLSSMIYVNDFECVCCLPDYILYSARIEIKKSYYTLEFPNAHGAVVQVPVPLFYAVKRNVQSRIRHEKIK